MATVALSHTIRLLNFDRAAFPLMVSLPFIDRILEARAWLRRGQLVEQVDFNMTVLCDTNGFAVFTYWFPERHAARAVAFKLLFGGADDV